MTYLEIASGIKSVLIVMSPVLIGYATGFLNNRDRSSFMEEIK